MLLSQGLSVQPPEKFTGLAFKAPDPKLMATLAHNITFEDVAACLLDCLLLCVTFCRSALRELADVRGLIIENSQISILHSMGGKRNFEKAVSTILKKVSNYLFLCAANLAG